MVVELGTLAEAILAKTGEIDSVQSALKTLETERTELENRMLDEMQSIGTKRFANDFAEAKIEMKSLPKIEDFDKFQSFVLRSKALYLFERRIARKAYAELVATRNGKAVPGIDVFEKLTLSVTRAKK